MKHYYTDNTDLPSEPRIIHFHYRQHDMILVSDHGVFSKERVDYGSRVLLDAMDIQPHQQSLLDVGCGYGVFGACLKKEYPWLHVEMVDINERAVDLAKQSVNMNHLNDIHIYQSDLYENVEGTFDMIVSNPPIRSGKKNVFEILEKAYDHLNEDGELFVVIQKKQGAPSAKKKMEEVFHNCEVIKRDKGYFVLKSQKKHHKDE